ncbi:MAG: glucosaminidase domain-containing protein [Bacteroidota bacterium]
MMRKLYALLFISAFLGTSIAPLKLLSYRPAAVKQYLQKYRFLSRELHQNTGIPEPVILAIAGLESNWGKSELALQANNHFGIKTKVEWEGLSYCKTTIEYEGWFMYHTVQCFRRYPYIRESYQDFGNFILTRDNYAQVKNVPSWNYRGWIDGLREGGYATDPAYTDKILRIIWRYKLYELVEE